MIRPTEGYVFGTDGPVVIVPARIAAKLEQIAGLDKVRVRVRGIDGELDRVLSAWHLASLAWKQSATGTTDDQTPELRTQLVWFSTTQAGDRLDVSDRAIRKAIAENRLPATRVGRCWRIRRQDVEHFRAARAA